MAQALRWLVLIMVRVFHGSLGGLLEIDPICLRFGHEPSLRQAAVWQRWRLCRLRQVRGRRTILPGRRLGCRSGQIVEQMESHDRSRNEELKHYRTLRHYEVEYKGLGTSAAKMTVEANYDSATGKDLQIVSESGSEVFD